MRMPGWLTVAAVVSALAGCATPPGTTTPPAAPAPLKSGVILENFDRSIRPGDDFTGFVNGAWLETAEIPADKATYGVGYMVHERSQDDVRAIIEEASSGQFAEGSDEQKVGDLYRSYMDMDRRNALGASPLADDLARIDAIASRADLAAYFAYANMAGLDAPITLFVYPDLKNPTTYAMNVWQGGLGLPDREYYLKDDDMSRELREAYVAHVQTMLDMTGVGGGREAADRIMALETRIATEHMKKEQTRDIVGLYNPYARADLADAMPTFDWAAYLDTARLSDAEMLVIAQRDYARALDGIVADTDLETWRTYFKWVLVRSTANTLDETLDNQHFEFYGKVMTGAQEQLPRWRRAVNTVNAALG